MKRWLCRVFGCPPWMPVTVWEHSTEMRCPRCGDWQIVAGQIREPRQIHEFPRP